VTGHPEVVQPPASHTVDADQRQNSNIMVVDDQPANLKLLEDMLRQQGYIVHSFPRGRQALAAAAKHPPDLILLDINMPEMNGYEVCERLKSDERLCRIPVIFLSALDETEDKVKAFRSGAVDYVTKPFRLEEVQARVQIHLQLVHLQRQLQLHNDHLEELVRSRTHELTEANARLRILDQSKSDFLNLISHEFRTPLNGLFGIGELLLDEMASTPQANGFRDVYESSRRRILTILEDASLLTEIEVGPEKFAPAPVALASIVNRAIERTAAFSLSRRVAIRPVPSADGLILGVEDLMIRAIQALLETAVQFSTPGETVRLEHRTAPDAVRLLIESQGYVIPDALLPKFFDLLAIGEAIIPGGDLGLAPAVAARILALFGASVSVENHDSTGIRLTVCLKRAEPSILPR
jgi:two-component system sensor histidine kinase/response regulator